MLFSDTSPDLLLLDIHLPGSTGLELLRSLAAYKPFVIITTAFQDHALEGFELNVVDYLLKPISNERLSRAVDKVFERKGLCDHVKPILSLPDQLVETAPKTEKLADTYLTVKDGRSVVRLPYGDIILLEAMDDYVKIFTDKGYTMTLCSLSQLEKRLPVGLFTRINRSFIVRHQAVRRINSQQVELVNGRHLNIGRTKFRQNVQTLVQLLQ